MVRDPHFKDKKFLLIDKASKRENDRTWCYWEKEKGFFEEIVYKQWDHISFLSPGYSSTMAINPYKYKMIRGTDFFQYCYQELRQNKNIEFFFGDITQWEKSGDMLQLKIGNEDLSIRTEMAFNSVYRPSGNDKEIIKLIQHFKGWIIETPGPVFDPGIATMMDFRVHQDRGTSFAYVLPFTTNRALVEYTLFTKSLLSPEEYDEELRNYIQSIQAISDYKVIAEESGAIPMTTEPLHFKGNGIWNLGTAGGQTKASSGYTFQFIQKHADQIVRCLRSGQSLDTIDPVPGRFRFYDNTLLYILYHEKLRGADIFSQLFRKNKPGQVLRFLDNESTLLEELKIISSLPVFPFLNAAIRQF